jgi:uncharacterized Ntn-hydrolase superfamily protein
MTAPRHIDEMCGHRPRPQLKRTSTMKISRALSAIALMLAGSFPAFATWSIVAVDKTSGQIVVASATCLRQAIFRQIGASDLRDIQAVVIPGKAAAVGQAAIDTTRRNQQLLRDELEKGTDPAGIIELLRSRDSAMESRQFGIVDLQGRSAGFTGKTNQPTALAESGRVGSDIYYQMQGNILASDTVIHEAARAFKEAKGTLADRAMAAMEAADGKGGDKRCTDGRTAFVAYIIVVDKTGEETYTRATDEDSSNPITALRQRYK